MLTDAGSIPATSTKPQKHKGHRKVAFVFVRHRPAAMHFPLGRAPYAPGSDIRRTIISVTVSSNSSSVIGGDSLPR